MNYSVQTKVSSIDHVGLISRECWLSYSSEMICTVRDLNNGIV